MHCPSEKFNFGQERATYIPFAVPSALRTSGSSPALRNLESILCPFHRIFFIQTKRLSPKKHLGDFNAAWKAFSATLLLAFSSCVLPSSPFRMKCCHNWLTNRKNMRILYSHTFFTIYSLETEEFRLEK